MTPARQSEIEERRIAAENILRRREMRSSLVAWARFFGAERNWVPAAHHLLLLEKLQAVTDGTLVQSASGAACRNLSL